MEKISRRKYFLVKSCESAYRLAMNKPDDLKISLKYDESAQMLEDWIDLRTSGNHAQLNNLYCEINDKSQEEWPGLAKDQ